MNIVIKGKDGTQETWYNITMVTLTEVSEHNVTLLTREKDSNTEEYVGRLSSGFIAEITCEIQAVETSGTGTGS